jgi:hypothetical protein
VEELLDAILDHPTTGHVTVASLRAAGGFAPLRVSAIAYADRKFDSPSGKVEFYSSQAEKLGLPPLPVHKDDKADNASPYSLALSFGRTLFWVVAQAALSAGSPTLCTSAPTRTATNASARPSRPSRGTAVTSLWTSSTIRL